MLNVTEKKFIIQNSTKKSIMQNINQSYSYLLAKNNNICKYYCSSGIFTINIDYFITYCALS